MQAAQAVKLVGRRERVGREPRASMGNRVAQFLAGVRSGQAVLPKGGKKKGLGTGTAKGRII